MIIGALDSNFPLALSAASALLFAIPDQKVGKKSSGKDSLGVAALTSQRLLRQLRNSSA